MYTLVACTFPSIFTTFSSQNRNEPNVFVPSSSPPLHADLHVLIEVLVFGREQVGKTQETVRGSDFYWPKNIDDDHSLIFKNNSPTFDFSVK